MPVRLDFSLAPEKALEYLRNKGLLTTFFYDDIEKEMHHLAFTVAKMMRADLLGDVHDALLEAQKSGKRFDQFLKELRPTLQRKGWWGRKDIVNPDTGEVKTVTIGARRIRNIFNTNMRVSYAVARCRQMKALETMVYWRYSAVLDRATRPTHAARNGTILHRDDPWWKTNYPPNGWGCRCKVRAYSAGQIARRKWKISSEAPDDIASKDWAYDVCGGAYGAEREYFQKVQALTCKRANARKRKVLCPFADIVREHYREEMRRLLPSKQEWDAFVDRALDTGIKHHEHMRLGYLSFIEPLREWLGKNNPQSDLILADTGSIRNLKAKGMESVSRLRKKQGVKNTLSTDDIKALFDIVSMPSSAYYDGHLLLVYDLSSRAKIVLNIDAGDKKSIYHSVHSGQLYLDKDAFDTAMDGKEKIF